MIVTRIAALSGLIFGLMGCASTPDGPRPAKLSDMPNTAQMDVIAASVRAAMGREDLSMDAGRLVDTSRLIVRPVAMPGLTDRVPGTPTRFILLKDGKSCWLQDERSDMRIDLPSELRCT